LIVEYTLLAAVDDEVKDEAEILRDARNARLDPSSFTPVGLRVLLVSEAPSGIADNEDIVTLGLGGMSDDAEDAEDETDITDPCLE
jgi:hypothetical protein